MERYLGALEHSLWLYGQVRTVSAAPALLPRARRAASMPASPASRSGGCRDHHLLSCMRRQGMR